MTTSQTSANIDAQGDLVIERIFDAPRELVFRAFTEPQHIAKWWGPIGWHTTVKTMDVRPGGTWLYGMRSEEENMEAWGKAVYQEIVPPEKLVYTDYFADSEGNVTEGMPVISVIIEFIELDGQTKIISRARSANPEEIKTLMEMGMVEGLSQSWDRLSELLQAGL